MQKLARLVVDGWPVPELEWAEEALFDTLSTLKLGVKYLITPGGFTIVPFPAGDITRGWNSGSHLALLAKAATPAIEACMTQRVKMAAAGKVEYITINVDLRTIGESSHAELIAVVAANGDIVGWTGKSFPTMDQEKSLVHITSVNSHKFRLKGENVLVLGCHDLNVFNNRSRANQKPGGPRSNRCQEMLQMAKDFKPDIVLHHPHGTDTWKSWNAAWLEVGGLFPEAYGGSAISYCADGVLPRAPLAEVLPRTLLWMTQSRDILVPGNKDPMPIQKNSVPTQRIKRDDSSRNPIILM